MNGQRDSLPVWHPSHPIPSQLTEIRMALDQMFLKAANFESARQSIEATLNGDITTKRILTILKGLHTHSSVIPDLPGDNGDHDARYVLKRFLAAFISEGYVNLLSTVWDDVQFSISNAKVPAANYPSWEAFTANTNAYAFDVDEYIDLQENELPHAWKENTVVYPHLHIAIKSENTSGAAAYAKFTVYLTIANKTGVFSETPVSGEVEIPDGAPALTHYTIPLETVDLDGYKIGSIIKPRMKRIAATGGTEYADDVFILQAGIHIEKDTLGSRAVYVK
jgi:hypothetical protein